jgi:UDP-glucose 4-epimerase
MRILVTGGAGYVGSVSVACLVAAGHAVTVLDNLVTGHRSSIEGTAELVSGSLGDRDLVAGLLQEHHIEAVLHCGARSLVSQSVSDPALYYNENVVGGIRLLDAMRDAGVDRLVFSSTAAVYGAPESIPIREDDPTRPMNPYGETKLAVERAMRWYSVYGLRTICLRYFNVAGASELHGEDHSPETHLIPRILAAVLDGEAVIVYGTDYPTPDGTNIRDYIHVLDLADAHIAALERTGTCKPGFEAINLGSGGGFSVLDVLRAAESVVGRPIANTLGPRRAGDPPVLVASNDRATELLGWHPVRGSLDEMIGSAWVWMQRHRDGGGT